MQAFEGRGRPRYRNWLALCIAVLLLATDCHSTGNGQGAAPAALPATGPAKPSRDDDFRSALDQGLDAYAEGHYTAARAAFTLAAKAADGRGRGLYMQGLTERALGEHARAQETLLEASDAYPVLGDHALYYAGRSAVAAGNLPGAIRILSRLRAKHPDSLWRADAARIVGRSDLTLGNFGEAKKALRAALREGLDEEGSVQTRLALGEAHARSGDRTDAIRIYRDIWIEHPEMTAADDAGRRLAALQREAGNRGPLASFRLREERANHLYSRYRYDGALEAYQELQREALAKGQKRQAYSPSLRVARTLFRLKRYPEATRAFRDLLKRYRRRSGIEEMIYWEARSVTRERKYEEALSIHRRLIARHGRSRWARESRFRLAMLLEDRGRFDEARREYGKLLARGAGDHRKEVLWRLGWIAYKQGRMTDAQKRFDKLAAAGLKSSEGRQGAYWAARVLGKRGRKAESIQRYESIVRSAPRSFYGFSSAKRLAAMGRNPRENLSPIQSRSPRPSAPQGDSLGAHFARGLALARLRQNEDASRELHRVRFGSEHRLYFALLFQEVDDYYRASRLIDTPISSGSLGGRGQLLRFTYPEAYEDRVRRQAAGRGLAPHLLWAVMREESTYRPAIMSPAGAVGLMQIMPATAERIGPTASVPDAATRLEDPGSNIALGAYYLGWLMARYEGRVALALAAYNAGEDAVDRWRGEMPAEILSEEDAFIEEISYRETRNYVKKVLRSYNIYLRLYPPGRHAAQVTRVGEDRGASMLGFGSDLPVLLLPVPLTQLPLERLAARVVGNLVDEIDAPGNLEICEPFLAVRP